MDSRQSWVETTCPPGWGVLEESDVHWSVYCCEPGGDDRFVTEVWGTREDACRQAWERWALEVLGDRVEWTDQCPSARAVIRTSAGEVHLEGEADAPRWCVYMLMGDGERVRDPVEALARLAFLTGAVLGPAGDTEEKSKDQRESE